MFTSPYGGKSQSNISNISKRQGYPTKCTDAPDTKKILISWPNSRSAHPLEGNYLELDEHRGIAKVIMEIRSQFKLEKKAQKTRIR